jgi:hypothetical protein
MALLGLDIETTGLHSTANLLTLYMAIIGEDFQVRESLDMKLKPNASTDERGERPIYSVQAEAMKVNGIDLIQHDLDAISYKEAKTPIYNWIQEMSIKYGELTPFGNLVTQDINKITECTISRPSWDNFVDRRVIELSSLGKTLQFLGRIPKDQSLSLSKIANFFNIQADPNLIHTAAYDVWLGTQVLKGYTSLM